VYFKFKTENEGAVVVVIA